MQQPLTADLGAFVAGLRFDALPPGAAAVVRQGFTDLVGCMIAGRNEEAPQVLRTVLQPADGRATLYFSGVGASLPEAVWINGTAAHALDYDDGRLLGHIRAELVGRDPGQHHMKGWHPTGIFGPIAAAAACASLLRLDRGRCDRRDGIVLAGIQGHVRDPG